MTYKFLDLTGLKQTITQIFSKLKAVALSGSYTDLINKPTIVNNGTTTATNTVLDGRMGKTLADKDANLQSQITSLNSSLVFTPRYDTLVDGSSFDKNFLAIYLPAHENRLNAANYFSKPAEDSEWRNIPSTMTGKLWLGYRAPQRMGSTNELVVIMEHYPVFGRIWTNYYNSGTWQGWKSITPE